MLECTYLIVGSGKTSLQLAQELNRTGKKIIIVEASSFGGQYFDSIECVNDSFLEIGKYFQDSLKLFRDYPETFAVLDIFRNSSFNGLTLLRENKIKDLKKAFEAEKNIELIEGQARFISNSLIEVLKDEKRSIVSFENLYICTGKIRKPKDYGIESLDLNIALDKKNIFNLQKLPEHVVIPECNYESIKIANLFSNLGVKVTVIDSKKPQDCFKHFDQTILNMQLKNQIRKQVDFCFSSKLTKITKSGNKYFANVEENGVNKKIKISHVYLQFDYHFEDTLNLKEIKIDYDNDGIKTAFQKTANDSKIYVLGQALSSYKSEDITHLIIQNVEEQVRILQRKDKNFVAKEKYQFLENIINFEPESFHNVKPVLEMVEYSSLNFGLSELDALGRHGPQVEIKVFKTETVTIKIVFNSLSGLIFGLALYGEIKPFYGLCFYMYNTKKTCKELYSSLNDTRQILSLK